MHSSGGPFSVYHDMIHGFLVMLKCHSNTAQANIYNRTLLDSTFSCTFSLEWLSFPPNLMECECEQRWIAGMKKCRGIDSYDGAF